MKTRLWRLFPLLLLALVGGVVWYHQTGQAPKANQTLACPDIQKGCSTTLGGKPVKVSMQGELKPLKAFLVRVEAPGAASVEARFTMEGMDMGFNLYTLRAEKSGMYQASVTLPVCVTGRRDWAMHLNVDGLQLAVPFVTDL